MSERIPAGFFHGEPFVVALPEHDRHAYERFAAAWRDKYGFYGAPPSFDEWVSIGKPTGIVEAAPPALPPLPPRTVTVTVSMPERGLYDKRPATAIPSLPASGEVVVSAPEKFSVLVPQRSAPRRQVYRMEPAFESAPAQPTTPATPAPQATTRVVVDTIAKTVTEIPAEMAS